MPVFVKEILCTSLLSGETLWVLDVRERRIGDGRAARRETVRVEEVSDGCYADVEPRQD
jgi:hypothetical protein